MRRRGVAPFGMEQKQVAGERLRAGFNGREDLLNERMQRDWLGHFRSLCCEGREPEVVTGTQHSTDTREATVGEAVQRTEPEQAIQLVGGSS